VNDPTDCTAKALKDNNAKLDSASYDSAKDEVTINLNAMLKIKLVLKKVAVMTLPILSIPGLEAGPTGQYKGSLTFLGQTIAGDLTFGADTVSFKVTAKGLDVDCPSEPYTCDASGNIVLTDVNDPTDCTAKALKDNNAKLDSASYDSAKNEVTVNIDAMLKIKLVLKKVDTLALEASPSGEYSGTKTVLGESFTATMKFSTTTDGTVEFTIAGPVALDCTSEPYTYASGTISLTNLGNDDDCVKSDLDKYSAKLKSLSYDEGSDKITASVKYSILTIDLEMDKVSGEMVVKAVEANLGGAPAGEYKGTKTILGDSITADMKFSTTGDGTVEFTITGPITLDCKNEAYTYSSGTISLTNIGSSDDCVAKAMSANHVTLKSLTYDESSDTVTADVKYSFLDVKLTMNKQSGEITIEELPAPLKILGGAPAGEYKGSKSVLGITVNADMKFSATTLEFGITGAVTLDCSNEPYTYSDGTISLTNIGNSDDCVKKDLDKEDVKLESATYDESSDKITLKVKHGLIKVELDMGKVSTTSE